MIRSEDIINGLIAGFAVALVMTVLITFTYVASHLDSPYTFTHGAGCPVGDYDH